MHLKISAKRRPICSSFNKFVQFQHFHLQCLLHAISSISASGHYSLPALARLLEVIRRQMRSEHSLMGPRWLPHRPLSVMVACHQEIHEGWWKFSRYQGHAKEVRLSLAVVDVRKSSVVCVSKVMTPDSTHTFVTLRFAMAIIDAITRKSAPLSDDYRARFHPIVRRNMSSCLHLSDGVEAVPSVARLQGDLDVSRADHHVMSSVMQSDIDHNQHANNSVYVRYAINAAHDACRRGHLGALREALTSTCPKAMDIWYRSEVVAGDELDIYLWKDLEQASRLHVRLHCKKRPVCYITFTYTDKLVAKL